MTQEALPSGVVEDAALAETTETVENASPVQEPDPVQEPSPVKAASFGYRMRSALGAFFRGLIRLVAILIVFAVVVILVNIIPRFNQTNAAEDRQEQARWQELHAQQTAFSEQVGLELERLSERILALDQSSQADKQALEAINAELARAAQAQEEQQQALAGTQAAVDETVGQIDASLGSMEQKITRLTDALNQTADDLATLEGKIAEIDSQLSSAAENSASESPLAALRREVVLMKAMEMLTRGRLYLVQNNLGLAQNEVQAARDLLAGLLVPDYQQAALEAMIMRLDLALANLPGAPVLAAEDLEIAWRLLSAGLPPESAATAERPAVGTQAAATSTPTPASAETGIPETTSTPTP